ncbi:MAG: LuxR C-terminal-related transcriptional regulator, partial [Acetatifactor sp.]|nr:LuxR C-terminal-related transcriptional regulator [Acetatifactor sp.]
VMTRLAAGYEAALYGGQIEMCFAAVGGQVRQHIAEGQYHSALRIAGNFRKAAKEAGAVHLFDNMKAFETWLSLYTGLGDDIREYIKETEQLSASFAIIDRYRCMVRVRCLIAENRLPEAIELANFLGVYFERYERHLYEMENELQKGIILYRMGDEHYKEHIKKALIKACEYHFIRVISLEGAALLPLLREMGEEEMLNQIDEDFLKEVLSETERISNIYPDYMKYIPKEEIVLTKRESEILSLLCGGYTTEEICEKLGLKGNALKKHNYNLYKKLGVASRAEAERKAVKLGLVIRS